MDRLLNSVGFCLLAVLVLFPIGGFCEGYAEREEVARFIKKISVRNEISAGSIKEILSSANYSPVVLKLMARPAEALPWYKYQKIFLHKTNIRRGVKYWRKNAAVLKEVSDIYGVPPEIIVAIIGVESSYDPNADRYKVLDTLTTLSFDYPARLDYFQSELEHFMIMADEKKIDPYKVKGSYAGAMGLPQFMPSSYRRYAVDFNDDGKKDLWHSDKDVIASVANYFYQYGWKKDEKIAVPARVDGVKYKKIIYWKIKPKVPAGKLKIYGVESSAVLPEKALVTLLELQGQFAPEYWVGLNNFYVITRYNRSINYGMAVYQLSEKIHKAYYNQ